MTTELRRGFHDDLAALHALVGEMADIVVEGIRNATTALLEGDSGAAEAVVAADGRVDEAYEGVETLVAELVARQSPVARDLRFLIATLRVAQSLERAGDLVASIARRASRVERAALTPAVRSLVYEISGESEAVLRAAARSYAVLDGELASAVRDDDDRVDDLHRRLMRELVTAPGGSVESTVELALVARFYERIADHGVVVAERVRFVSSGAMEAGDHDETT